MANQATDPGATTAISSRRGQRGRRLFYGWWIAGGGFVINTLNGALLFHVFGTYVVLLQEDFGWSRTSFSFAFALMRVESGLLGPIEGWAIDRYGPRAVMRFGVTIFALGLFAFSQVDSLLAFYLAFLVIALGSALGSFLPMSVAVVNWFNRRRATALTMLSLGFSAGGLLQPLVVAGLNSYGWRGMAVVSGVVVLAIGLPLTQLVRHRPEDYGYLPDGLSPEEAAAEAADGAHEQEVSFTARQALRTSAFWYLALGHAASLLVFGAVSVHFVAHVTDSLGFSLSGAAAVITLMTAMMVVGQVVFGGFIGDRVNKKLVIVGAMFSHTAALALLAVATQTWMVLAFAVLNGLAMGARGPLTQALRAEYFGRASFGTIMGFSSLVIMVGIVTGPVVAGMSYDMTGSYRTGFLALAAMSGLGSLFFVMARKPALPLAAMVPRATPTLSPAIAGAATALAPTGNAERPNGGAPQAAPRDAGTVAGSTNGPRNGAAAETGHEQPPQPTLAPDVASTAQRGSNAGDGGRLPPRDFMGGGHPKKFRSRRDYMENGSSGQPAEDEQHPQP